MPEFITLQEASELARVPLSTVRLWVKQGKINAVKVGKKYLTTRNQVILDLGLTTLQSN